MDSWGRERRSPWLGDRVELSIGPLFCIVDGPTQGRSWSSAGLRVEFRRLAREAGVRRRFARISCATPTPLNSPVKACPLNVIRASSATQSRHDQQHLQSIDTEEIIATVHARRAPMMSATAGLQL